MFDGLKHAFRVKPFLVMLLVAFIVMSTFNGVTTWVEQIIKPRGFTPTEAGTMGALMLVAGVIGAVVLSALSDRSGRRVKFMVIALVASVPGVLGVAFASSALLLYAFAALLGFFLVAVLPLGMQYAAEIANPTPEGTSTGLIQLCGQVSVVLGVHHGGAAHLGRLVHRVAGPRRRAAGRDGRAAVAAQGRRGGRLRGLTAPPQPVGK